MRHTKDPLFFISPLKLDDIKIFNCIFSCYYFSWRCHSAWRGLWCRLHLGHPLNNEENTVANSPSQISICEFFWKNLNRVYPGGGTLIWEWWEHPFWPPHPRSLREQPTRWGRVFELPISRTSMGVTAAGVMMRWIMNPPHHSKTPQFTGRHFILFHKIDNKLRENSAMTYIMAEFYFQSNFPSFSYRFPSGHPAKHSGWLHERVSVNFFSPTFDWKVSFIR